MEPNAHTRPARTIDGMSRTTTSPGNDSTTWQELRDAAAQAARGAYAPYSHYHVGAAAKLSNGEVVTGANVENASYGLTLCAECMIVSLTATRGMRIEAIAIVNGDGDLITPCGRCRQLLAEHAAGNFRLLTTTGEIDLAGMLPLAFSASELTSAGAPCGDEA